MNARVQLKHPRGKKPVSMSKEKYDLLKSALVKQLRTRGAATFGDLSSAITKDFKSRRRKFEGSIPWHLEWVKLDLEARRTITRVEGRSSRKYRLTR